MSTGKNYFVGASAGCLGAVFMGLLALKACENKEAPTPLPAVVAKVEPAYVKVLCYSGGTVVLNKMVFKSNIVAPYRNDMYWYFVEDNGHEIKTNLSCTIDLGKP